MILAVLRIAPLAMALSLPCALGADELDAREKMALHAEVRATLEYVARAMGVKLRSEMPLPTIHLASVTPLARFQDAIEAQWGFRPHLIANAYVVARNEIYLDDSADYYRRRGRTLDDSLAHELVHYLQAQYLHQDLGDDSCEMEAVVIQRAYGDVHATRTAQTPSLEARL